jgi:hypothetical protein
VRARKHSRNVQRRQEKRDRTILEAKARSILSLGLSLGKERRGENARTKGDDRDANSPRKGAALDSTTIVIPPTRICNK